MNWHKPRNSVGSGTIRKRGEESPKERHHVYRGRKGLSNGVRQVSAETAVDRLRTEESMFGRIQLWMLTNGDA